MPFLTFALYWRQNLKYFVNLFICYKFNIILSYIHVIVQFNLIYKKQNKLSWVKIVQKLI